MGPMLYDRRAFCFYLSQPVPWKFEGSPTQGLDEQPTDPIIERLRQNLASVSTALRICCNGHEHGWQGFGLVKGPKL